MTNRKDAFSPSFFEILRTAEENHFWFNVRKKWIADSIHKYILPPATILEVGCGTGNVSSYLSRKGYAVTGCEYYDKALDMAWPGFTKIQGDIKSLPFPDNKFDVVGLFDVIEHLDDDIAPLKEAVRVLRRGGLLVVAVPAQEELWSWVDEASYHKRRYTKKRLKMVLSEALLEVCRLDYMFMTLYFPMKFMRSQKTDLADTYKINKIANILAQGVFEAERMISRIIPLPLGTSLVAVAKRR